MSTTLTEKEIKVLIDEHRRTISKLENQRSLIAFLVLLTLISVFLLGIVGNILLTISSFIIGKNKIKGKKKRSKKFDVFCQKTIIEKG